MNAAREEILARIRLALADRPEPEAVIRDYRQCGTALGRLDMFIDRLIDYKATVHHAGLDVATQITTILHDRGHRRIVVPAGFPEAWLPALDVLREPLTAAELDAADGVLTTCTVAIAETGTIVLNASPGQGRRALTLVPDYHLIVVRADQVHPNVPDAIALLNATRPLTWISGPSATSDIELNRVEGVHGPRTLDILIIE